MFTSKKSAKIYLSALLMTLLLWGTGAADRLGVLISEPDGNPADSYVYKIIFPNGTTSITGNVLTYTAETIVTTQAVTVADSGADSDAAAFNLTPTAAQIVAVAITCNDDDGCTGTMIETSATHGDIVNVMNLSTYAVSFAYSAGVLEHQGGTGNSLVLNQYNSITLKYQADRWVVIGNESSTLYFSTINAKTATFSLSGVAGTTQLGDVTTAYVLTDAEVSGTIILHDANESGSYTLPTAAAGMNTIINACYSGVTVAVTSGTTCYVDGAATAGATGTSIESTTVGEYFTAWTIYDAAATEWRWAIRKKDD